MTREIRFNKIEKKNNNNNNNDSDGQLSQFAHET